MGGEVGRIWFCAHREDAEGFATGGSEVVGVGCARFDVGGVAVGADVQVAGGTGGDGKVGVGVRENFWGVSILPARQVFQDSFAGLVGLCDTAVKQHEINGLAALQKGGEVAGDGGVFRVGEAHFPQPGGGEKGGFFCADRREEAVQQNGRKLGGGDFGFHGTGEEGCSGERYCDGPRGWGTRIVFGERKSVFFDFAATGNELGEGCGRELPVSEKFFFRVVGESQIQVVATEEQVVADGDSFEVGEGGIFGGGGNLEEAQVGRAAPDIHDEDEGVWFGFAFDCEERFPVFFHPGVERGLGFFEEDDRFLDSSQGGSIESKLLGGRVKRGRDGDGNLLVAEGGRGVCGIPSGSQRAEEDGEGFYGTDPRVWRNFVRAKREELRAAVGGVVDEP